MNFGTGKTTVIEKVEVLSNTSATVALHPNILLNHVYQAVHLVDWPKSAQGFQQEAPEPVLRTVLTYCYAAGILSSPDIQSACFHDSTVRYICANDFPSWQTIREFRRRNLPWLSQALQHLFRSIAHPTRIFDARLEAERRIARAIQADSNAMDD